MVVTNNHTPQASMKVEGIDTEEILSRVKEELANEPNISPALKSSIEMILVVFVLLLNRLGLHSKNSSKPPSSNPNREKKKLSAGKKAGGQPGHKGVTLEKFDTPDVIKTISVNRDSLTDGDYSVFGFEPRQVALSKRDYDRFGIKNWLDRGWEVQVFDFTKFLKPEVWESVNGEYLSVDFDALKIIENDSSALILVKSLKGLSVFVDLIDSSRLEQKIRTAAKKKGVTLKLKLGSIPEKPIDSSILFTRVQKALKNPFKFFPKVAHKIRQFREDTPDYFVVGGNASQPNTSKDNPFIIMTHNLDYDFFISDNTYEIDQKDGGIVFLDEDAAHHSDYVHLGVEPHVTPLNYFQPMSIVLTQIAKSLGSDVRIAAHPRSDYDKRSIKYSLPILKDQTFELIKKASVVVAHSSTALQWSIFMRKPIILITTDELNKNLQKKAIEAFAFALGKEVVNINKIQKNYDWNSQLFVDETKYQKYVETYIKQPGSPEEPLWEIVINRIESDLFHE
jgi:hypothetical protein